MLHSSYLEPLDSTDANPSSKLLNHPDVVIKNPKSVLSKVKQILKDGAIALHIITDFDMTLTKHWVNGQRNFSSHSVLAASKAVSESFINSEKALCAEYYPIEISTTISFEEKYAKMVEWWERCHSYYIEEKLTKDYICDVAHKFDMPYREGAHELIDVTAEKQIPVLVFSAGIGDIIEELLRSQKLLQPHVHVVSNSMSFDDEAPHYCNGFKRPLIHVLNKGEVALKETPFYNLAAGRGNAILMGDSLGDIQMAGGLDHKTLLTVGFLNYDVEKLLPSYMEKFDVVITNDASFDWVHSILNQL
ncbi:hypothetical protein DSO57_1012098 [Entomophthora muscae]|uniref:Uncharacterized protein n=1 Tax=Entomophthora muscae TaxID=34485 RepID=A0ACC2SIU1_9FUNG|nr:hypothetical protein DSO57_1012098 [Entomophthora muscae]